MENEEPSSHYYPCKYKFKKGGFADVSMDQKSHNGKF